MDTFLVLFWGKPSHIDGSLLVGGFIWVYNVCQSTVSQKVNVGYNKSINLLEADFP